MRQLPIIRKPGLFLALLVLTTACSDVRGIGDRFRAEKMYYHASRMYQTLRLIPGGPEPDDYQRVRASFLRIIWRYPISSLQPEGWYDARIREDLLTLVGTSQLNVADLFFQEGQIDSAITMYRQIIEHHRSQHQLGARAQYSIALSYQRMNRWPEAVSAFQALLKDYPPFLETPQQPDVNMLQIPAYLASTLQTQGDSIQANSYFERAREYLSEVMNRWPLTPTARMAQDQIASTFVLQGRWSQAVSAFQRLSGMSEDGQDPPDALFAAAALCSEKLNDLDQAMKIYRSMIERYPGSKKLSRAYLAIGRIYLQRGMLPESREVLEKIIEDYPEDAQVGAGAQFTKALSYEMAGDWDKAVNEFRWVMDNYPYSPEAFQVPNYILDHYLRYGEKELAQSAYRQAVREYSDVIQENPGTPRATQGYWFLAQSHIRMERWQETVAALESLMAQYPQSQQAFSSLLDLGEIYEIHLGRAEAAMRVYRRIIELAPGSQSAQIAAQRIERFGEELE